MKKILLTSILFSLCSCALPLPSAGAGFIFTKTTEGVSADSKYQPMKRGEACGMNVLGIVSLGDSSIDKAKRASGITKVATVDRDYFSVLGLFAEACTVIQGE